MMQVVEDGKIVRPYEPAPGCVQVFESLGGLNEAPESNTSGVALDPHDSCIGIEVAIAGGDETSTKAIKLWLFSRAIGSWHAPDEGIVTDLHSRPGMQIFYVLADPWLYERAYVEITQNDGEGVINANLISR
jgi:hypothetical protein